MSHNYKENALLINFTLPAMIVIFPEHLSQPLLRPHRTDYNYTMMNHAVPMNLSTPNRSRVYNFDFYTPKTIHSRD